MRSIRGADGLRALACLMVIFHHLCQRLAFQTLSPELQTVVTFLLTGFSGVSIFFVLSGFLLAYPFWEAYGTGAGRPDLRVYALRRAARILPGFYLNLLVCFFLGLVMVPEAPSLLLRYFSGLTLTAGFHWLTFFPAEVNGPLWSISFEIFSYVLMPLAMVGLFAFLGKKRSFGRAFGWWILVFAVTLGVNQLIQQFLRPDALGRGWQYGFVGGAKFWSPGYNPIGFFGHFTLGILAAGLAVFWTKSPRAQAWAAKGGFDLMAAALVLAWLGTILVVMGKGEFALSIQHQPYFFPLFPAINALLLASLCQSRWMGRLFDNPFCRYTARISFGLYLWHSVVLESLRTLWWPGFAIGQVSDLAFWGGISALVLVVAYAIASLSWFFFEKPILDRAHRWKPAGRAGLPPRNVVIALATAAFVLIAAPVVTATMVPAATNPPMLYFPAAKTKVAAVPPGSGTLTLQVSGVKEKNGKILAYVYAQGNLTPQTVVASAASAPEGGSATVVFANLPFGVYALAGFQDTNGNGQLDVTANGMPAEGILGAPGQPPTGPPDFDRDHFVFDADRTVPQIVYTF